MSAYLLKSEPEAYSIDHLIRDRETIWDGVSNPAAVRNLAGMKKGDHLVIYHTGDERQAVGTATVVSVDPANPKNPVVKIKAGHKLKTPHTLADIKAHKLFADSPLVRQGRLSVVPLSEAQFEWLTSD
jgi:predicted RNA-binding protein with PUA-like domain